MKKQTMRVFSILAFAGIFVTGCKIGDIDYVVTPDPLEMHGDSVRVKVEATFPEKGLPKKMAVELTPKVGSTELKTVRVQGEKATGNGDVIQYKAGGKVTYEDIIPYKSDMEASELTVSGRVFKGEKEKDGLEAQKIADATIITPYLVNKDFKVIIAKDQFKRVTEETFMCMINFDKGRSTLRGREMSDQDIKDYTAFLEDAQSNPKIEVKNINVVGYASPEGEVEKNDNLSNERAETGKQAAMTVAKKAKHEGAQGEMYSLSGRGEDYDGFKRELQQDSVMNEDEKNLVLRVLETIADPAEREKAMRDMGKTFTYLDKHIFPQLRRAEIIAVYDKTGFSDEELMANSVSNPDTLNLEELLFTATLYDDLNEKLRVYRIAEGRYPEDYRAANNVGAVLYMQNKMSEAQSQFEKANGIEDNVIAKNNLAAIAGVGGDREKAMKLLNQAGGAGDEVSYNKGIINIQDGDYGDAVSNLGSEPSFNKALAQLLNGSETSVAETIDASPDAETGQGYYLKAIAAAHADNLSGIVSNLKNSISKDGSFKAKAAKDREFVKYFENAEFSAIVK